MPHSRLGCSTITFRHLPLDKALAQIAELGFTTIDLGALPGVCDHVPYVLDPAAVTSVAATVTASGLRVRSINGDVGDLNVPLDADGHAGRERHLEALLTLAGTTARAPWCCHAARLITPRCAHWTTTSTWSSPS